MFEITSSRDPRLADLPLFYFVGNHVSNLKVVPLCPTVRSSPKIKLLSFPLPSSLPAILSAPHTLSVISLPAIASPKEIEIRFSQLSNERLTSPTFSTNASLFTPSTSPFLSLRKQLISHPSIPAYTGLHKTHLPWRVKFRAVSSVQTPERFILFKQIVVKLHHHRPASNPNLLLSFNGERPFRLHKIWDALSTESHPSKTDLRNHLPQILHFLRSHFRDHSHLSLRIIGQVLSTSCHLNSELSPPYSDLTSGVNHKHSRIIRSTWLLRPSNSVRLAGRLARTRRVS